MSTQSELTRIMEALEYIGFTDTQLKNFLYYLEGKGTLEERLSDLKDALKNNNTGS